MDGVYSLDMLTMDFKIYNDDCNSLWTHLMKEMTIPEIHTWSSFKMGSFKDNCSITVGKDQSFYFGVHPNSQKPSSHSTICRLEFNPTKVSGNPIFEFVRGYAIQHSKLTDIKRFDIAIDIPVAREDVLLYKDQRQYRQIRNSAANKTEYLGQRSHHGHVKLYNKQIQANLPEPLSRLEITMDYDERSYDEFKRLFPVVQYIQFGQLSMDDLGIDDDEKGKNGFLTDRVLVFACLEHPEYLKMLSRIKQKKIACILEKYTQSLKPNPYHYKDILSQILEYCNSKPGFTADYRAYRKNAIPRDPSLLNSDGFLPWDEPTPWDDFDSFD